MENLHRDTAQAQVHQCRTPQHVLQLPGGTLTLFQMSVCLSLAVPAQFACRLTSLGSPMWAQLLTPHK